MPIGAFYSKHSLRGPLEHPLSRLQIQLCPPPLASVGRKWRRNGRLCDWGCPDIWARLDMVFHCRWIPAAMWGAVYSIRCIGQRLSSHRGQRRDLTPSTDPPKVPYSTVFSEGNSLFPLNYYDFLCLMGGNQYLHLLRITRFGCQKRSNRAGGGLVTLARSNCDSSGLRNALQSKPAHPRGFARQARQKPAHRSKPCGFRRRRRKARRRSRGHKAP